MEGCKKYAVWPGLVTSKTDGQVHFISAAQLVMLYGVKWDECIVYDAARLYELPDSVRESRMAVAESLIPLRPRYDGNYTLPKS